MGVLMRKLCLGLSILACVLMVSTTIYAPTGGAIDIEKYTNGEDADAAPGPTVPVGGAITFAYTVENTGSVMLYSVYVEDDVLGYIGGTTTMNPGASITWYVYTTAAVGQYENHARVTAADAAGNQFLDTDASHYFGQEREPSIPMLPVAAIPVAFTAVAIFGIRRRRT
jgi:hypothetical protein